MVKVAVAGGSSNVGAVVINALQESGQHSILLLTRKNPPKDEIRPGITWAKTDYQDKNQLVEILRGQHTVLSFVDPQGDEDNVAQKNLIHASIEAGVKRFAPSEWSYQDIEHFSWYARKGQIREYLKEVNKNGKVLEYCLFAPGLFTNYFTYPHRTSGFDIFEMHIDFDKRRALVEEGGENGVLTLTTAQDFGKVVARAIEFEGEWPVNGGIQGSNVSVKDLIAIGERVRSGKFSVEYLKTADLKSGEVKSSWLPKEGHHRLPGETTAGLIVVFEAITERLVLRRPSHEAFHFICVVPAEFWKMFVPTLVSASMLGASANAFAVSDEWNRLLPDCRFTDAETFLREAWQGKP